jgi:hypothetical protein
MCETNEINVGGQIFVVFLFSNLEKMCFCLNGLEKKKNGNGFI